MGSNQLFNQAEDRTTTVNLLKHTHNIPVMVLYLRYTARLKAATRRTRATRRMIQASAGKVYGSVDIKRNMSVTCKYSFQSFMTRFHRYITRTGYHVQMVSNSFQVKGLNPKPQS